MNAEQITNEAFQIIMYSGNGRSFGMEALEAAKAGNFEEARKLLEEGRQEINQAHQFQTNLIQAEARGEKNDINVILIHSQDHLMTSMVVLDMAEYMIDLFEEMAALKKAE